MMCLLSLAALGDELRLVVRRRCADGLSVAGLARHAGVSQPLLANWLAGRRSLSPESIDAVRAVLRVGICELLHCDDCASLRLAGVSAEVRKTPAAYRVLVAIGAEQAA